MMWLLSEADNKMLKKYLSVVTHTNKMGLEINERKAQFMLLVVSRKPYNENEYVKLGTETVGDCMYFDKSLTNKNELIPETEKEL